MRINVLDHGYVTFIEAWGRGHVQKMELESDHDYECGIIEAARQSTQGNFRGWDTDSKLLARLFNNRPQHATPFEFAGMVIEVQAPIFVFREWQRPRTQAYNEMSARYAALPELYYWCPSDQVLSRARKAADEKNKQAASVAPMDEKRIINWVANDERLALILEDHYKEGLSCGVPKELARKKMPVDHYSRMRAATSLRNWLAFLTLRMDPGAQLEIRQFANAVGQIIATKFPQTWKLFAPAA